MQDRPTAAELVEAVREFLEHDVMPAVDGRVSFHARVAVNVLAAVGRELELGPALDADERARLAELLGHDDASGDLRALNTELAARIRDGSLDVDRDLLLSDLRATARDKLSIANPKYLDQPQEEA